ncbi:MAG: ATP-binding protein [bacterium]|nr:ATP-binding protein [bacterium]
MISSVIKRYYQNLGAYLKPNKVLVIYGPRQVGKTTLVKSFLGSCGFRYIYGNGGDVVVKEVFEGLNLAKITEYSQGHELVVIDEAQKIPNIGEALKLLVDSVDNIRILVTGSSSFELAGQVGEPLTGRKVTLTLFPVSLLELAEQKNKFEIKQNLEQYLVYGNYPEVLTRESNKEKEEVLNEIINSYLLRDILELDKVKGSKTLLDLLRLLAFQVGSEVSLTEIGSQLGMDKKTVGRYLDLFEKSFVIFNLRGYSRNLRDEIKEKSKYYFYDNGVRNAVISNFNSIAFRNDIGPLWENFLFMERMKKRHYTGMGANTFFWRTWGGQEIDLLEEREGELFAYEFKYKEAKVKKPEKFLAAYPQSSFQVISKENFLDFVV